MSKNSNLSVTLDRKGTYDDSFDHEYLGPERTAAEYYQNWNEFNDLKTRALRYRNQARLTHQRAKSNSVGAASQLGR